MNLIIEPLGCSDKQKYAEDVKKKMQLTDEEKQESAEEINTSVANYIDAKITEHSTKEQLNAKLDWQKWSRNVKLAREVKSKGAIYDEWNAYARKKDPGYQTTKELVAKSVVAMGKVAPHVISMQKEKEADKMSVVGWSKSTTLHKLYWFLDGWLVCQLLTSY